MATFGSGILNSANIADSAITSAKIADGAIVNADINASADIRTSKLLASDVAALENSGGHITINPFFYSAVIQGTWAAAAYPLQWGGFCLQNTGAQNDQIDFKAYLAAGTYTLKLQMVTQGTAGIYTFLIDGASIGTIEGYSAGNVYNVISSITGITIATSGLKTISMKMATKNASSSAYYATPSLIAFFRTA